MKKIVFRLDKIMQQKGIKQEALAKELGISLNTIKAYRNNWVQRPDLRIVEKICEALGVSVNELLTFEDEKEVV